MKSCDLVLFGAMGDLARRKLVPSLYQLDKAGLIAPETTIVGVSRRDLADETCVAQVRESLETFLKEPIDGTVWERFARRRRHAKIDLGQADQYGRLRDQVDPAQRETVVYCAVAPDLFGPICSAGETLPAELPIVGGVSRTAPGGSPRAGADPAAGLV